jgi:branched-chain amino acid transport system permease protein
MPVTGTPRGDPEKVPVLAPVSRAGGWWWYLVPLLALPIPLLTNEYTQYIVNLMLVYILVATGFNIVIGNLGQLAFANAAFFGIGAYTTGILMFHLGVPFWIALVPSGVVGALAGALTSVPALRGIRLFYLAIITLAFGELMRWVYIHARPLTMGSLGMSLPAPEILGFAINTETAKFYVFLVPTTLLVIATANLLRSRIGRAIVAIRENELAAASLAIPTAFYFVLAFMWSGFLVGVAGGMFAVLIGHIEPESFKLFEVIRHFAIVMAGGLGSLAGSVIGAIALTAAPELFRGFPGLEELFFALVVILILVFLPRGLVSLLARHLPAFRERLYRE